MPWIIEGDDHIGEDVDGGEEEEGEERQDSILPDMDVSAEEGEEKPATSTEAGTGNNVKVVFFSPSMIMRAKIGYYYARFKHFEQ